MESSRVHPGVLWGYWGELRVPCRLAERSLWELTGVASSSHGSFVESQGMA